MVDRSTAAVRLLAGDKEPVRVASTSNLSLSGLSSIDGVTVIAGDRVLVKDQADATENGIYTASAGSWRRAPDAAASRTLIAGMKVAVQEGTDHGGDIFVLRTDRPNMGDDDIEWDFYLSSTMINDLNTTIDNGYEYITNAANDVLAVAWAATNAADFPTRAIAAVVNIPTGMTYLRVAGLNTVGDGGAGIYKKAASEPTHAGKFQASITGGGTSWFELVDRVVTPEVFGGVGNGTGLGGGTDDTTALQNTLNYPNASAVNLLGRTWRVDGQITLPANKKLFNGTLDFTNRPSASYAMTTGGSDGASSASAAISVGQNQIGVPNGALFRVNQWIYIKSDDIFDFAASYKGEWQQIKSIAGNLLTLYSITRDRYDTNPRVYGPDLKSNIVLEDLTLIGGGAGLEQRAIYASHVENFQARNVTCKNFMNRAFDVRRAIHPKFLGCHVENGDGTTGNSYGFCIVNGTEGAVVDACSGSNLRHLVTLGGEDGVDWSPVVNGCTARGCSDSAIDCHPNTYGAVLSNNTVDSGHPSVDADENRHGITIQGARCTAANNVILRCKGIGIHVQPLTKDLFDHVTVIGNTITTREASTVGIFCDLQKPSGGGWGAGLVINGNSVFCDGAGSTGIAVEVASADAIGGINGVTIEGNNVRSNGGAVSLKSAALKYLTDVSITGRYRSDVTTGFSCIEFFAGTTGTYMAAIRVSANIRGGVYGVRNTSSWASSVVVDGCTILGNASGATNGTITAGTNAT